MSGNAAIPVAGPTTVRLSLIHARAYLLETVRVPIAMVGNMVFPALALLFFVVPAQGGSADPRAATVAVTQLAAFAVLSAALFSQGIGIAEDRSLAFDTFVRALPAGAAPRLAGRVLTGLAMTVLALVPLIVVGAWLTPASVPPVRLALGGVTVLAISVPFTLLGCVIGFRFSAKAAIAVVQLVVFPLAFVGGLFIPPAAFPVWLDRISLTLPSRAARDLLVEVTAGPGMPGSTVPVLVLWTACLAALAVLAYRHDVNRRR